MTELFQVCLLIGAAVLALQVALGLLGVGVASLDVETPATGLDPGVPHELGAHAHDPGHAAGGEALSLLSVRSVSAALATFGAAGLALLPWLPRWLAGVLALLPAFAAAVATAWLMRRILDLQSSGSLQLAGAVGCGGKVYLTVPASSVGSRQHGLVHVTLQGRTAELRAVTREPAALPSGAEIVVVSVDEETETVEVVPASTLEELLHDEPS